MMKVAVRAIRSIFFIFKLILGIEWGLFFVFLFLNELKDQENA